MTLRLLIDMNLSPDWAPLLAAAGWPSVHWSTIGDGKALDPVVMEWARTNNYAVFTHDLDFSAILALTRAIGPSVLQVRSQNVLPDHMGPMVLAALRDHSVLLSAGAVVSVDEMKSRVRILPII
jgi:predicted nuclease of predicted toxin-antitoxin system